MFDLTEIAWDLFLVYGAYALYKRFTNAAQSPVVRKIAARQGINLMRRFLK